MNLRPDRWKYHLNGVLVLLPLVFLGDYLAEWAPGPKAEAIGLPEQPIGTCRATAHGDPPLRAEPGNTLDFLVRFRPGCFENVRVAFLAIRDTPPEPASLLAAGYGAILHGGAFNLHAHVAVPERLSGDEALWLVVEDWNGAFHRTAWSLRPYMPAGDGRR